MSRQQDDKTKDIFSLFGPEVKQPSSSSQDERSRPRTRTTSSPKSSGYSPSASRSSEPRTKRTRRAVSDQPGDKDSPSTDSSDLPPDGSDDGAKNVSNRREKLFIIDLLKNAEDKKEQVRSISQQLFCKVSKMKAGGPMPDDVKEMLGLPVSRQRKDNLRSRSEPRSPRTSSRTTVQKHYLNY